MTPQEITDYKLKWRPGYTVPFHSDYDDRALRWCKQNVEKQCYHLVTWTAPYEHSIRFEDESVSIEFKKVWGCNNGSN